MPAAKTESAEAMRRAFIASVISHSPMFAGACTVRARKASALRRIGVVTVAVLQRSGIHSLDLDPCEVWSNGPIVNNQHPKFAEAIACCEVSGTAKSCPWRSSESSFDTMPAGACGSRSFQLFSCVLGVWLMFSRMIFGTEGALADSDHLAGALIITMAVCAMDEVARPLRFLNLLIGLWLIGAPWLLTGGMSGATWNDVVAGLLVVCLSLPRGSRSTEHYGV
jgi:SPW repeat